MSVITTTYLEMLSPAGLRPRRSRDPRFRIEELPEPQWQLNRRLYFEVGEQWHWFDKRPWSEEQWRAYANDPALRTFIGEYDAPIAGYFELHRAESEIEIAYFGLLPDFIGRGLGGALLTSAIEEAWSWGAQRVWLHTCNLDHPSALQNYLARGFLIYDTTTACTLPNES